MNQRCDATDLVDGKQAQQNRATANVHSDDET